MREIEILSPAGSMEGLKAAIHAGCDAVYIGGTKFGARAYAKNLEVEDMLRAIDYAHIYDKKIYMTVNTLLKEDEIREELYSYLLPFYENGIDAFIVQDLGVLQFIHTHFKDIDIHASTQMSLTMGESGELLKEKGVTRIVNARELSLGEIKQIRESTDLEIESFVHGALCFCYSGQCFMSSMFGGRSGNRGRCAQPCRMPYELKGDGKNLLKEGEKHVLSPKDISTIDMIPDLIEAGIDSLKIEGRMKRPEYAAGVTHMYRKHLDKYLELGREKYEEYKKKNEKSFRQDMMDLNDLYNRGGFSNGYYTSRNGSSLMSFERPNHSGVLVGKVTKTERNQAAIQLTEDIYAQDILEIRDKAENLYEFTVKTDTKKGESYDANFNKGLKIKAGNLVYRTKNNHLLETIHNDFIKQQSRQPIHGKLIAECNKPLELTLFYKEEVVTVFGDMVSAALNQPMTVEKLEKQMVKLADSNFIFSSLEIQAGDNIFVPVAKLNELRRKGIEELEQALIYKGKRKFVPTPVTSAKISTVHQEVIDTNEFSRTAVNVHVLATTEKQLETILSIKEVRRVYMNSDIVPIQNLLELTKKVKKAQKECYIAMPYIMRSATYRLFARNKTILTDNTIDGYLIRNLEEYALLKKEYHIEELFKGVITDYNLYTMNSYAKEFFLNVGIKANTAPIELNYNELKKLKGTHEEIVVYGHLPLMVTAQCFVKNARAEKNTNFYKDTEVVCADKGIEKVEMTDRMGKDFNIVRHCRDCYNIIYNTNCISLLSDWEDVLSLDTSSVRLQFTTESEDEVMNITNAYISTFVQEEPKELRIKDFTRGHFRRGIE